MILRDMQGLIRRVVSLFRSRPHGADARLAHVQIMEAVSRLAGGIAHDLNNILLVVQGYTEMALAEKDAGPESRAHLAEVRNAAARASALVGDLLVVGRGSPFVPRLIDVNETLALLLPDLKDQAGKGVEVLFMAGADLPPVLADEELIGRLAAVLCARARDAMPDGGSIAIQTQVSPASRGEDRRVLLRFSDTGPRVPEEMRLRLFEPYFPGMTGGKGYGLRLSLVHRIVKRFGGEIEIEGGSGGGTTFVITLPAQAGSRESRPVSLPPRQHARAAEEGRTILLAEDDEDLRALATKALAREGFTILAARDGQEAVEIFERQKDVIRLVLLDDVMPRMGGRAALARMRQLVPGLPAILCSGYTWSLEGSVRESGEACIILPKPWQPREMIRRVREGLEEG